MKSSSTFLLATAAFGLSLAATAVSAQPADSMMPAAASSSMGAMGHMDHMDKGMMRNKMHHKGNGSMHQMPATVTEVDTSSGIVEVNSAGMSLRVHFPPASVAKLKAGDKITLHMGFTQ